MTQQYVQALTAAVLAVALSPLVTAVLCLAWRNRQRRLVQLTGPELVVALLLGPAIIGSTYFAPADLHARLVELARLAGLDVDAASFDTLTMLSRLRATLRPAHRRVTPEGTAA